MPLLNPNNPLNKPISLSNLFWVVLVLILLSSNIFLVSKYASIKKEVKLTQVALETQKTNEKVLEFTYLFINEVLKAETEIDFETRLKLESTVRNLDDEEILSKWKSFTESKSEVEAQEQVKNLLEMLVNKIRMQ